jgi:hypothetical protein
VRFVPCCFWLNKPVGCLTSRPSLACAVCVCPPLPCGAVGLRPPVVRVWLAPETLCSRPCAGVSRVQWSFNPFLGVVHGRGGGLQSWGPRRGASAGGGVGGWRPQLHQLPSLVHSVPPSLSATPLLSGDCSSQAGRHAWRCAGDERFWPPPARPDPLRRELYTSQWSGLGEGARMFALWHMPWHHAPGCSFRLVWQGNDRQL